MCLDICRLGNHAKDDLQCFGIVRYQNNPQQEPLSDLPDDSQIDNLRYQELTQLITDANKTSELTS